MPIRFGGFGEGHQRGKFDPRGCDYRQGSSEPCQDDGNRGAGRESLLRREPDYADRQQPGDPGGYRHAIRCSPAHLFAGAYADQKVTALEALAAGAPMAMAVEEWRKPAAPAQAALADTAGASQKNIRAMTQRERLLRLALQACRTFHSVKPLPPAHEECHISKLDKPDVAYPPWLSHDLSVAEEGAAGGLCG